jgi:DNA-binding NtrC family response regulator
VAEFEASIIHRALDKFKGNVSTAAEQLKLGKTALYDKMKQHNISAKHIKQVKKNR